MLYLAMLRAAGLTAYAVKVVDRDEGIFDPTYMNIDQLDDTLVILSAGGKEILLDPGEKMCPFQTVSWRHSGTRASAKARRGTGSRTPRLRPIRQNTTIRTGDITVDAHGAITGDISIRDERPAGAPLASARSRNDMDEVKKRFDRDLEAIVPDRRRGARRSFSWDRPAGPEPDGHRQGEGNAGHGNRQAPDAARLLL